MLRGTFKFEVYDDSGHLNNSGTNVERLRSLWLDRSMIKDDALGPGDPGDFDHGAWHVACHLLGGCGMRRLADGKPVWLQVSHDGRTDRYFASATVGDGRSARTVPLDSAEGRTLLLDSTLLGFVEGTSLGRVSARFMTDPPTLFNLWRRQDFDQPPGIEKDGGRVWEHWCTLRDIRPEHAIGTSVLTAFISLVSVLGDLFIPTVARGRREYGHPGQLRAMVRGGLVGEQSAVWSGTPTKIPENLEAVLQEADAATSLKAATSLDWSNPPRYYMFARKLAGWSKAEDVKKDLAQP
jgi:hypothetical protein